MKFSVPSVEYFKSQVPSVDSFMAKAETGVMNATSKVPTVESIQSKIDSTKYAQMLSKAQSITTTNTPGDLAAKAGDAIGIKIDSSKIDTALTQINDIKSSMQSKALDGVTTVAEKVGVHVDVPTQEDLVNMLITQDMAENMDSKIAEIESYINSKLDK